MLPILNQWTKINSKQFSNGSHQKLCWPALLSFTFMSDNKCNLSQQNMATLQCKQIFLICLQHFFLSYDGKPLQFNESLRHWVVTWKPKGMMISAIVKDINKSKNVISRISVLKFYDDKGSFKSCKHQSICIKQHLSRSGWFKDSPLWAVLMQQQELHEVTKAFYN